MRVKRYIVDTMPEAMQHIRTDLGKDAVILSTKETKVGGFLGMFRRKKIEVIAAVEQAEKAKDSAPPDQTSCRPFHLVRYPKHINVPSNKRSPLHRVPNQRD